MAKKNNEAKIKFTAETGEFNKAISKASDELSELKAELKANEAQMKNTGATVEALEKQHSLLENQLKASQSKTEALTQKVAKAVEIYGENSSEVSKLKKQLANAKAAEEQIKTAIAKCNTELEQQADAAKEAETATAKLTDKIEKQQTEVDQLKKDYVEAVIQYGKTSKEAKDLAKQIKKLSGELADSKSDMDAATSAADKLDKSLDDVGDAAKGAGDGFTVAKGAIADLASNAIQSAISAVSEFIGYLVELPEATREIRQDMATLETSFERQGFSTEEATNTWKELYKVFGEDDRAVEAANLISKMSKNQEDLSSWVTITKGIWGTYQDSLPVEGLAEASNETAKTGKVTGVLADALNWSSEAASMFAEYMSEDVTTAEDAFNEALAKCTTEQERQALITETLTTLYGDAATEYEKASGSQIKAKDAAAENILVQNELADTLEPLTTVWQDLKNTMLSGFLPAAQSISDWGMDALEWMKEHPKLMQTLGITLGIVAGALGAMAIAWGVYTAAQWLANTAILGCPLVWIVVAIVAVAAAIAALVVYWDDITAAIARCWEGVKATLGQWGEWINTNVIQPVKNFFGGLGDGIVGIFQNVGNWFSEKFTAAKNGVQNAWSSTKNFFSNIWSGVKSVFSNVGSWFKEKFTAAKNGATNAWSTVKSKFTDIKNGVVNAFSNIKEKLTAPFTKARDVIKGVADKIKGFFKGEISMPKIKLPHFSIKPKGWKIGDLLDGVKPTLGIEWYAKGGIFKKPTIFNTSSGLKGVGEAGAEAVLPIDRLQGYITGAIEKSMSVVNLDVLATAVEDLANRPIEMNINGRQFALATAGDTDSVNGLRTKLTERGLAL